MYPITLITYNRPFHTYKTLEALSKNFQAKDADLYVYSDGPKGSKDAEQIDLTLKVIQRFNKSFNKIIVSKSDKNNGTAKNMRDALKSIFFEHKVSASIILEDDIITSKDFLFFMNSSIDKYKESKNIWHVSGFNYPVIDKNSDSFVHDAFFWRGMTCWGWATWKDRYESFENDILAKDPFFLKSIFTEEMKKKFQLDLEKSESSLDWWQQVEDNASNKIYSWAIFWYAYIFRNDGLCLNPVKTLVNNIGFDSSATNCVGDDIYQSDLFGKEFLGEEIRFPTIVKEDQIMVDLIKKYFTKRKFYKSRLFFKLLFNNPLDLTGRLISKFSGFFNSK